jgi:putative endonuclease
MRAQLLLGRSGEDLAAELYRRHRFRVLDRNWRCSLGEIDLVAARGRLIVFCEVKARSSRAWGEPSEAVDARKQARLRRLAGRWLADHSGRYQRVRFDVVSIVTDGDHLDVTHIPDAF